MVTSKLGNKFIKPFEEHFVVDGVYGVDKVYGICIASCFRYKLSVQEAERVVQNVKKSQVDSDHVHPVSLLDIWSPNGLLPEQGELHLRSLAEQETAKLPDECSTIDAVLVICERLKTRGLEQCKIDDQWRSLLHHQLRQLEEVTSRRGIDVNILLSYHSLLWKTGQGWTYQRTPKERSVQRPYHPAIIGVFGDKTCVKTEFCGESHWSLDLTEGGFHHSLSETTGTHDDWKEIGLLQFFSETLTIDDPLVAPISQDTASVSIASVTRWGLSKAKQENIDMGEDCWPNSLTQDEFTLTNSPKKLYDIRPDVINGMPYVQFLMIFRLTKDKKGREYKSITEELKNSDIGPLSTTTLIAGTQERVPRFMRFRNSSLLKLRDTQNIIPMLVSQDQTLDNASKIFLFKPWRRPELLMRDENLATFTEQDLKVCDRIRLELFPESFYCNET